jgi:pyruvate formate lyase activating enzyme
MKTRARSPEGDRTAPGELYAKLDGGGVRCFACAHRCTIQAGHEGACRVRVNAGGELRVPFGYVSGVGLDPIEKKPFFHVLPGSPTLSFGMLGCSFRCLWCQNWQTSQAGSKSREGGTVEATRHLQDVTPQELRELCASTGAPVITSTYNEPFITAEWAVAIMREARQDGVRGAVVSNGHGTPEVLAYLAPFVDFWKIDLKGFDAARYRATTGGSLDRVLETIRAVKGMGKWLEVVTLVVPGVNDSDGELGAIAGFLASVSADIPWHVTAFRPEYKMADEPPTPAATLLRACEAGKAAGLKFVYAGNLPGRTGDWENTKCPGCGAVLVERKGFTVIANRLANGSCPDCHLAIPGVWA